MSSFHSDLAAGLHVEALVLGMLQRKYPCATMVAAYKGYVLYSIQTSAAAWVTLYTSQANRTADASRTISTDPTPGTGVVAEAITSGASTVYFSPAVSGYSAEATPTTSIPIKVYNNGASATTITVTLTLLQTEN